MHAERDELARLEEAKTYVRQQTAVVPKVALTLGSGLGDYANTLSDKTIIPYESIPHMPQSGVVGHAGNLIIGKVGNTNVVAMQGRVHLYEGHPPADVVFGTRLMLLLGADSLLITNAAGGANSALEPGDLMVIDDHLNLTGTNALLGPNIAAFGPRFPDMTEVYDRELRALAHRVAQEQGFTLRTGVYAGLIGPAYETPAEVRMLQRLGADAVGMSTVIESMVARHMNKRVIGLSCITNKGAGLSHEKLSHGEVTDTANRVKERFSKLLTGMLQGMAQESVPS